MVEQVRGSRNTLVLTEETGKDLVYLNYFLTLNFKE